MATLEESLADFSATGLVQLVADEGVVPFYQRLGYGSSPSQRLTRHLNDMEMG